MKAVIMFLMMAVEVMAGDDNFIKKIRETRIKNGCDESPLMSNFCAAVYDGPGPIIIIDSETAVTMRGLINRSGDVYNTPEGTTIRAENVWLGPNGRITIEALESFIRNRNRGVSVRNGQVYVGTGRTAIVSGGSVFKTREHKQD